MKRAILILAGLCIVLFGADAAWRHALGVQRDARARLRPLLDPALQIVPARVRQLRILLPGGGALVYERRGATWRFPAYFNAWAQADRIDAIVQLLTSGSGTLATTDRDRHNELGVGDRQALSFELAGAAGALVTVHVGRGIPGPAGEESYARVGASDTVLHLHANPLRLVGAGQPPLLDPLLLPRGLERGPTVEIRVRAAGDSYRVRRIEAPLTDGGPPRPGVDRFRWLLEQAGRVDTCIEGSVLAWLGQLHGARIHRLVDPATDGAIAAGARQVELVDEAGARDRLRLGAAAGPDEIYVANEAAGTLAVLAADAARALAPPASALLDSTLLREALR